MPKNENKALIQSTGRLEEHSNLYWSMRSKDTSASASDIQSVNLDPLVSAGWPHYQSSLQETFKTLKTTLKQATSSH